MAKIGSRRTGGNGIDVSGVTGFVRFIVGSEPSIIDFATQEQAEVGLDPASLMSPLLVRQAIEAQTGAANSVGYTLGRPSPPTEDDNALVNNDQNRPFAVRDLWQHVKVNPPTAEEDVDWYRLEAFRADNSGNGSPAAIWALAEQVDASVLNPITTSISDLQTALSDLQGAHGNLEGAFGSLQTSFGDLQTALGDLQGAFGTLQTEMADERSRTFESSGLLTVDTNEVIIELPSIPNDNSVRVVGQTSGDQGLFPFIGHEDFALFGSWLFFRDDAGGTTTVGNGNRSVDDGDKLDIDWFTNLANPPAITGASFSGGLNWNVAGIGHSLEVWRCPSGSDPTLLGNWALHASSVGDSGNFDPSADSGDNFILRYVDGEGRAGAWSDLVTA